MYVSSSHSDRIVAEELISNLKSNGIPMWADFESIKEIDRPICEIANAIDNSSALVFIASNDSIKSNFLNIELSAFSKKGKPIFIFDIDTSDKATLKIIAPQAFIINYDNDGFIDLLNNINSSNAKCIEPRIGKPETSNAHKEYAAFISYRHINVAEARLVYSELGKRSIDAFFDYEKMSFGRFDESLRNAIECSLVFIVILSKDCLKHSCQETDIFHMEIEQAIHSKKYIIPLLLSDFDFSGNQTLPQNICGISLQHAIRYNKEEYFNAMVDKIIDGIEEARKSKRWMSLSNHPS